MSIFDRRVTLIGYRIRVRSLIVGLAFCFSLIVLPPLSFLIIQHYNAQATQKDDHQNNALYPASATQDASLVAEDNTATEALGFEAKARRLQTVLEHNRRATGLAEIQSMRVKGSYREQNEPYEMTLSIMRPELFKKTLRGSIRERTLKYNGIQAKMITELTQLTDAQTVSTTIKNLPFLYTVRIECAFFELSQPSVEGTRYTLLDEITYQDQKCYQVRTTLSDGLALYHLISKGSGDELARYFEFKEDQKNNRVWVEFSEFKPVGAGRLPHAYTIRLNETVHAYAQIESYQLNAVLQSWMFE